jgi:hypothetical protein
MQRSDSRGFGYVSGIQGEVLGLEEVPLHARNSRFSTFRSELLYSRIALMLVLGQPGTKGG